MPHYDLPLPKLRKFRAPAFKPRDFDRFWSRTLAQARAHPLKPRYEKHDHPAYQLVDCHDLTFPGYDGQPVRAWFIQPKRPTEGPRSETANRPPKVRAAKLQTANPKPQTANPLLPCIVTFVGYGGGRSFPVDHLQWPVAGFAALIMDTRGQGSNWSPGHTPDNAPSGGAPQFPGFMTRGIESPDTYYYRRVFTDAVRAVETAAAHPRVDPRRIAVAGQSQGGGIAIAAASLLGRRVKLAIADVPFLCYFRRGTTLLDNPPYYEISCYLRAHRDRVEQTFKTLSYFDGVNFAPRITARCLFSVALMDQTCPPSTVFACYNALKAPKDIKVYDFNTHEGGGVFHTLERLQFASRYL